MQKAELAETKKSLYQGSSRAFFYISFADESNIEDVAVEYLKQTALYS